MNMIQASVIIPTYNGAGRISKLLNSLQNQTLQDFESIVAIDGSDDDTKEVVSNYADSVANLIWVDKLRGGRASARNFGALKAGSDLLIFYDDDMRPGRDSIERHINFHSNRMTAVCGGNQVDPLEKSQTDFQRFKAELSRKWTRKYRDGLNRLKKDNIFLTAANLSIPKKLFFGLGGFDDRLNDAEDFDLACRCIQTGIPVYFDKDNIAWHEHGGDCRHYVSRLRDYRAARKVLMSLKPDLYREWGRVREYKPGWFRKSIFSLMANQTLRTWIDQEKLMWVPRPVRYKIYDLIITGLGEVFPERTI